MKKLKVRLVVSLLLAIIFVGASSFAFASGGGEVAKDMHQQAAGAHEAVADAHGAVAADAHGVTAGEAGKHYAPMITKEKLLDLLWRTTNFAGLLFLLVHFLAKPVSSGLSSRKKDIQEELELLESKRDAAEKAYKEFEARLAGMEKEMAEVVDRAIVMAKNEKKRILQEAEAAAEDIKRQAEAAVQSAIAEARRDLKDEVAEQAATMAEELIVKNLKKNDHVAITEQYLERMGAIQ